MNEGPAVAAVMLTTTFMGSITGMIGPRWWMP
jgi:hypothetical protein